MNLQNILFIYSIFSTILMIGLFFDNKHNSWWKNYYKNCYENNEKLINEHINK